MPLARGKLGFIVYLVYVVAHGALSLREELRLLGMLTSGDTSSPDSESPSVAAETESPRLSRSSIAEYILPSTGAEKRSGGGSDMFASSGSRYSRRITPSSATAEPGFSYRNSFSTG